ncbi:MAG: hypothetical protein E7231_00765 [Cellulosilyticum sp.]|nr:hypothetical protein [Cellulosilyticum sp.]
MLYTNQYKTNGENMFKEILELGFLCIVFGGVLWLTYFATKKIGTANKKMYFNKNMEIIEVMSLMQGQYLYIVKVGGSYHLMGCAQKGNMTYLKELDENQLNLEENIGTSFQEHFIQFMKGKQVLKDEEKE